MSTAEIVQMVAEAMRPIVTELSNQSETRMQRVIQDANAEIRRLEISITQLQENQEAARGARRDAQKSLMDHKGFQKIEKFKDGHAKWKTIRMQFENLTEIVYPGVGRQLMRWARSIGNDELRYNYETGLFNFQPPNGIAHAQTNAMSQDLAMALSYVLEGEAESIMTNAGEGSGLDAWRRLQARFDPRSNARDLVDSQKIIHPPTCKSLHELLPALERWEEAIRQMNEGNRPGMLIQMGIAISMCPPKLQEHLQDMEDRIQNYQQLRAEIIRKVDLAEVQKRNTRSSNDANMDIGGLANNDSWGDWSQQRGDWSQPQYDQDNWSPTPWSGEVDLDALQAYGKGPKGGKGPFKGDPKGKGKGGKKGSPWGASKGKEWVPWKGGGKGQKGPGKGPGMMQGKGNGKPTGSPGEFQGYCHSCLAWGHTQRFCPRWSQDANNLDVQGDGNQDPQQHQQDEHHHHQSAWNDQEAIQMSSLECVHDHHDGQKRVRFGRNEHINYEIERSSNIKARSSQARGNIRFGSVDIAGVKTDNRYAALIDTIGEHEEMIEAMTLDRITENRSVDINLMNSMPKQTREYDRSGRFVKLTCTSDSGAGESVLPKDWFPEIPKQVSEEAGTTYAAANGTVLKNEGKKTIEGFNSHGKKIKLEWQLANVTKPLLSIGKLTQHGHRVVFDDGEPNGGYILHKASNTRTEVRKRNGTYEFDVWVPMSQRESGNSSFRRQENP